MRDAWTIWPVMVYQGIMLAGKENLRGHTPPFQFSQHAGFSDSGQLHKQVAGIEKGKLSFIERKDLSKQMPSQFLDSLRNITCPASNFSSYICVTFARMVGVHG